MERGTNGNWKGQPTQSAPKAYAVSACAAPSTKASYGRSSDAQGYRQVAKVNTEDKQSGSYQRYTAREEVSTGEMYRGRGHREYGVKDEYKTSSTLKVGDKSGYTEYYKEERVRNVSYGGGSHNAGGGGSKTIEYGADNNSSYGGGGNNYNYGGGDNNYGYDYDSVSDDDGNGTVACDNKDIQSADNDDGDGDDGQSCGDDHSAGGEAYSDASAGSYDDDDVQSYGCDSDSDY